LLASTNDKFRSIKEQQAEKLNHVQSETASAIGRISAICATAENHLKSRGISIDSTSLSSHPSELKGAGNPLITEFNSSNLGELETQLRSIQESKLLPYWPENDAAKWAIGLTSLCWGLGLLWFPFVFVSRLISDNKAADRYRQLVANSQSVRGNLEAFERHTRNDTETAIKAAEERLLPPASEAHASAGEATNQRFQDDVKQIGNDFRQVAEQLHTDVNQLWEDSSYAAKEWDSSKWEEWLPDPSPEFAARIGTLTISADDLRSKVAGVDFGFKLPALVPFAEGRCLLLNATGEAKEAAAEAMQSVAIRALANTPPGKARFTLIDPVGLGQNVADFMHLGDFNRDLINGKAWTEPQHIEQQLTKLTEDMETVIQTFLRKRFASIQEYNKEHHEVAEPFRFLVIFDFPVNFTESAARRLVSIAKNGPRCGVYTLILMDSSKKLPYGFNIEELRQLAVVFESEGTVSRSRNSKDAHSPAQPAPSNKGTDLFAVVLKSVPADKKIAVIKALRSIKGGLDLAEAKRLVESAPKRVLESVTKTEAHAAKRELEEAGAKVGVGEAPTNSDTPPPQEAEIGKTYRGRVVTIKEFGAFVEFLPGKDGLVHISELANFRVKQTEDIVKLGDEIWVKCLGVDEKGRVRLSRKAAMAERETNLEE
jgi:ribosomal protein L7/L12